LFHSALEQAPEARRAFLDDACGEDTELRRQVELLVSSDGKAGAFLDKAAVTDITATLHAAGSLVGRQLGQYRILSPLGVGGMGEVYRAHDSRLGRDVAIKTLPQEFARDPDRLARFRREARMLASLNHPSIGAIYGFEEFDGTDFLVLELVDGRPPQGPLPIVEALRVAGQITEALAAAHARGIVHRDLKPANVMVTADGKVKVLDFGLAKAIWGRADQEPPHLAAMTVVGSVAGHIAGTPAYMSPEQARGESVDQRTDIWAFGCLLFELLTGKRPFQGDTVQETIFSVLEREPDWALLPAKTPSKVRQLLRQCLEKDAAHRLAGIADARSTLEQVQRGWNGRRFAVAAVLVLAAAGGLWWRRPLRPTDSSQWVQLTKFPDPVSQPALSPDGRMVAFIRGDSTFYGPGQIYVKILPEGEPVQLTHDNVEKMSPAFSPDGARIAYTTYQEQGFSWDTWVVPVLGGEPQRWLKNASGLVWTAPGRVLFSEIKRGLHMGIVAAEESRMGARDVYLPANEMSMAHRSYLSPDGKWVLLVEMDQDHLWLPCRVVPMDGSSQGYQVGPPHGGCTFGAWSPDSKWIYLTSVAVGANHIWRQRLPDGRPEQITSGPTEEEGIAMAPDGRSFVTAVALHNSSLWVHNAKGERAILVEGNAAEPRFTADGKRLCYRIVKEPPNEWTYFRDAGEVRVADLESGRSEALVPGLLALDYDISADGRQVVMEVADSAGKPRLWLAPFDRSSPPRQVPNVEGGSPRFGPGGQIYFRHTEGQHSMEGTAGLVYRVRPDGTALEQALQQPILTMGSLSPDGRWLVAWALIGGDGTPAWQAFSLAGGPPVTIGIATFLDWSPDGSSVSVMSETGAPIPGGRSYLIPLSGGRMLPNIPPGGFRTEEEIAGLPGARRIEAYAVKPGPSPEMYAFYRGTAQRNLYRIPVP